MHLANYSVVSAVILLGESFKDHLSPSQLSSWELMSTLDEHHFVQVPSIQRMKAGTLLTPRHIPAHWLCCRVHQLAMTGEIIRKISDIM